MTWKRAIKAFKILGLALILLAGSLFAYQYWYWNIKKYYCSFDILDMYHVEVTAMVQDINLNDYICTRKILLTDRMGNHMPVELTPSEHMGIMVKEDTIDLKGRKVPVLIIYNIDHNSLEVLDRQSFVMLGDEVEQQIGDPHSYNRTAGVKYDDCPLD